MATGAIDAAMAAILEARLAICDCHATQLRAVGTITALRSIHHKLDAIELRLIFKSEEVKHIMATAKQINDALDALSAQIAAEKQEVIDAIVSLVGSAA